MSFLADSLDGIESITLLDAEGNLIETKPSTWTEDLNLPWKSVYVVPNPKRPMTLRLNYFSEFTTQKVPFVLHAGIGN